MASVKEIYQFDEWTWPEVNEAVEMGKIPILATGSVEQHGHHLPLKVDHLCAHSVAAEGARLKPELSLVLPPVTYGYVHHVMDFPGSLNIHYEHFIQYVLDICKSLAYHGFKKIIHINGHGSNHNLVDMVSRRVHVETDASCVFCSWWQLLKVNPDFDKEWRDSVFPGGCSHACELETSMLLHLSPVVRSGLFSAPQLTGAHIQSTLVVGPQRQLSLFFATAWSECRRGATGPKI